MVSDEMSEQPFIGHETPVRSETNARPDMTEIQETGIAADPMYKELTSKQQKFLLAYLDKYDSTEAALAAFECKTRDSAASIGYKTLQHHKIRKLVHIYRDRASAAPSTMSRSEFLSLLSERLRNSQLSPEIFFRLSTTLLEVTGWKPRRRIAKPKTAPVVTLEPKPEPEEQTLDIDAMVRQIEATK